MKMPCQNLSGQLFEFTLASSAPAKTDSQLAQLLVVIRGVFSPMNSSLQSVSPRQRRLSTVDVAFPSHRSSIRVLHKLTPTRNVSLGVEDTWRICCGAETSRKKPIGVGNRRPKGTADAHQLCSRCPRERRQSPMACPSPLIPLSILSQSRWKVSHARRTSELPIAVLYTSRWEREREEEGGYAQRWIREFVRAVKSAVNWHSSSG